MKFFYCVFLYLLTSNYAHAQVNLNQGLIGCYPFSGNADDLSGSNNNGKVSGAKLTSDRFGKANSAYDFDGIDDYIEISSKNLQLNAFSYSIWVSPKSLPSPTEAFFLFSIGSDYGDQHILLGNDYTARHNAFAHGSYQGVGQNVRCTDDVFPQTDKWYHIVLCKDVDNYNFYINGKLICANPLNGAKAFYGTGIVRAMIGARNNYGQASNVLIDDIHLYDRALNPDEIKALYDGDTSTPSSVTLKIDTNNPCGGEEINLIAEGSFKDAVFQWKIDKVLVSGETSHEFLYKLPKRAIDYELTVGVEVSYEASCFKINPANTSKIIPVKNCVTPNNDKKLLVPNAFTPNYDGVNDKWEILNWDMYPETKIFVYSHWGEVIFQSNGYHTAWDGAYRGKIVLPGMYPYKIYSEGKLLSSGTINILH